MPFDHILNWKLKAGSHEFPGLDGGTCINEAAIVAAGLPYRKVVKVADLPECFSRVIGIYALALNDTVDDGARQRLLPFVTRLAGSGDRDEIERARAQFIVLETVRRIAGKAALLVPFLDRLLREAPDYGSAERCLLGVRVALNPMPCEALVKASELFGIGVPVRQAGNAALYATRWGGFDSALVILDGALRIGRQAPEANTTAIVARMEAAKTCAREAAQSG